MSHIKTIIAATTPFNKKAIMDRVKQVEITKTTRGTVITKDNGVIISKFKPTNQYELVNFADAVAQLLAVVGTIFNPEFYQVNIKKGFQELKLRGAEHVINGDVHHEILWLTNSSDGSKRLSVRYGLMRQVCSNGLCVSTADASFKVKHLVSNNVNEELKHFMKSLPKLDVMEQVKVLKTISKKTIKVKDLIEGLGGSMDTKNKVAPAVWADLVAKFASSKTDRIGTKDDAKITGLRMPVKDMTKEVLDMPLESWKVLQCYTELFRSADASAIELHSNKITKVLMEAN